MQITKTNQRTVWEQPRIKPDSDSGLPKKETWILEKPEVPKFQKKKLDFKEFYMLSVKIAQKKFLIIF